MNLNIAVAVPEGGCCEKVGGTACRPNDTSTKPDGRPFAQKSWARVEHSRLWAGLLALLLLISLAHAAPPREFEVFNQLQEVSDEELDELRGRFISFSGITHFGIVMESVWKTRNGDVYGSGMELSLQGGIATTVMFRPTFTVISGKDMLASVKSAAVLTAPTGLLQDPGGKASIDSGGLENVTGVSQGIHIVSDSNTVANRVVMDVSLGSGTPPGSLITEQGSGQAASPPPSSTMANLSGASGESLTVTTEQGITLSSGLSQDGALVSIELPGEGRILQSVGGGLITAAGIRQNAEVLSQFNTIQNTIQLIAQMQDSPALPPPGFSLNKNMLSGLRHLGAIF